MTEYLQIFYGVISRCNSGLHSKSAYKDNKFMHCKYARTVKINKTQMIYQE